MTPDQIKPGHTYETTAGTRWAVESSSDGWLWLRNPHGQPVREPVASFAAYAVRDVTPAPESHQGEKVAQAQSQAASCGDGTADLTADDWLQIEMAAKGCVSGTSDEWPALVAAINKIRSQPLRQRACAAWLQGFCIGVLSMRSIAHTEANL